MKVCVVTGSRADLAPLEWVIKTLREDDYFEVEVVQAQAGLSSRPDIVLMLGDRHEILRFALECHLQRIPIAHIAGGDVTEGSYDDAMRDCISRMATIHFVTSTAAMARLTHLGHRNVHLVGSPGIDYIRHADWKRGRPIAEPYVVVSYQAETIDGTVDRGWWDWIPDKTQVYIRPNQDRGSDEINRIIDARGRVVYEQLPHPEFLNLIYHCDEFIGNSSAMLYEAPELGIKTRMIGKRQRGRSIPWGDGNASKRIAKILKYAIPCDR